MTLGGADSTVGTLCRVNSLNADGRGEILNDAFEANREKSTRNLRNEGNDRPRWRDSQNSTPLYATCGSPAISSAMRWTRSEVSSREILEIEILV